MALLSKQRCFAGHADHANRSGGRVVPKHGGPAHLPRSGNGAAKATQINEPPVWGASKRGWGMWGEYFSWAPG